MTLSLIISTYNWPQALELCLESVMRQRIMPTEILIADDGSGLETRQLVERFTALSPVPMLHIWHEDNGFRLAAIRNKAIAAAQGEYIVQIDGDIILHHDFIRDHRSFARRGFYVGGSRALITEKLLPRVLNGKAGRLGPFTCGVRNRNHAMRIPLLRDLYPHLGFNRWGRGCNMAFWRNDVIQVNGYDEKFRGWGGEDTEMLTRMTRTGIQLRLLRFGGVEYHIFHKKAEMSNYANNRTLYETSLNNDTIRCEQGVDQYLSSAPSLYPEHHNTK